MNDIAYILEDMAKELRAGRAVVKDYAMCTDQERGRYTNRICVQMNCLEITIKIVP